ncbi:hypothetical protein [Clostridium botulinum]|uniref:hypothetical protein n=1 Tax=Clostridium botulinum TaxID=1491 RepID=UPI003DA5BF55
MKIRICKKCGFILGTRPNTKDFDGVCLACLNHDKKKDINFKERQEWLTNYIKGNKTNEKYDCVVAVSGGKDSSTIVKRLIEKHGIRNPLLVTVADEFTKTEAGRYNINNLVNKYGLDLITFRCNPNDFIKHTREDFLNELHPLKWLEQKLYEIPIEIANHYNIKLVFFGENSAFEYGTSEELEIFHPQSTDRTKIIFMGAIYPYSIIDSLNEAIEIGFRDLDYYNEWQRQGSIENYTQIDSIGYTMHLWCKFVKFGFQRVSDIASRLVREGKLSNEQAVQYIKERDYICDPTSKRDFCRTIGITEKLFDKTVDKFANKELVIKDILGQWRRKDLI